MPAAVSLKTLLNDNTGPGVEAREELVAHWRRAREVVLPGELGISSQR